MSQLNLPDRPERIPPLDYDEARAFVKRNQRGVLATIKRDGRSQLSTMGYYVDDQGLIKISCMRTRAKIKNILRDGRVSLQCLTDIDPAAPRRQALSG